MSNLSNQKFLDFIREKTGDLPTPFYIYDLDAISERAEYMRQTLPKNSQMFFAVKANHHPEILKAFLNSGMGVDVVSGGELQHAVKLGFSPKKIVFSGVGKTVSEICLAVSSQVGQINVESAAELDRVMQIANDLKTPTRIAFRVNPDVEVKTHPYIQTGLRENKFGLEFEEVLSLLPKIKQQKSVSLNGLALHIGSQIRDVEPFRVAIGKALELFRQIKNHGFKLLALDVGGGVGIDYMSGDFSKEENLLKTYGDLIKTEVGQQASEIWFEPGRILVARFGVLVTEIQYVKRNSNKNFLIVDTGMNHLIRPALYQAHHRILPLEKGKNEDMDLFDVVGPICESADVLGAERVLPRHLKSGDRLAILDTGAYGAVMASDYNMRGAPDEYVFHQGKISGQQSKISANQNNGSVKA